MFEAIVALCLAGGMPCRDQLVPGYEAETEVACLERLVAQPPQVEGEPRCAAAEPVLDFEEIAPEIYVHHGAIEEPDRENGGDVSNLGFVVGDRAVAVIATGGARWVGEGAWRAIRARTDLPVTHVILTHMHPDHVFGASVFEEAGAELVGHAALERALADREANYLESFGALIGAKRFLGIDAPGPAETVGEWREIDLGGRVLEVRAWPVAHTPTDVTVVDRATGTLFAGDLVFDGHAPALDGSLLGWQRVLEELMSEPFARVVPGHGGSSLLWPEGAAPLVRYLSVLERETREAVEAGLRIGEAAESVAQGEAAHWRLFETYNPRNATVAFTELEWE